MKEIGRYDSALQMFVEKPREANMKHLQFLRDLAERGKFGPKPLSAPRGDDLFRLSNEEIAKYAMAQADQTSDAKLRQVLSGGPQSQFEQQH